MSPVSSMFSVIWYQRQNSNFAFEEDKSERGKTPQAKSNWKWLSSRKPRSYMVKITCTDQLKFILTAKSLHSTIKSVFISSPFFVHLHSAHRKGKKKFQVQILQCSLTKTTEDKNPLCCYTMRAGAAHVETSTAHLENARTQTEDSEIVLNFQTLYAKQFLLHKLPKFGAADFRTLRNKRSTLKFSLQLSWMRFILF